MTTLDAKALEAAWDAYMAAAFAEHPYAKFQPQSAAWDAYMAAVFAEHSYAKFQPQSPAQQEENKRFVSIAITAYLEALT